VDEEQAFSPTEADQMRMRTNMESMILASEAGSDSEGENNDEYINFYENECLFRFRGIYKSYNSDLVKEVLLVIEKVDEAVDALKSNCLLGNKLSYYN